jgi:hypothetical protein
VATKKNTPGWSDVKARLADLDRAGLIGLLQDLYAAGKENQSFLHARFGLGGDVLNPYKATIERWISPNVYKNQGISVAKAKKAISDYKKAVGQPDGLAELMVYFCERAARFADQFGVQDEGYPNALVHMFEQALKTVATLPEDRRPAFWERLEAVSGIGDNIGYGVGENMEELLAKYCADE